MILYFSGSLSFDLNGYLAVRLFAHALGNHFRMIAEFKMDQAALIGGHRLQHLPPVGLNCLVCHPAGQFAELALAAEPVALHINH